MPSATVSKYEQQANEFLQKHHLTMSIVRDWDQSCPPWGRECDPEKGKHTHGIRYGVVIEPLVKVPDHRAPNAYVRDLPRLCFPFWDSLANLEKPYKRPHPYEVLSCISGDVHCPESFEGWCWEFGYSTDSRSAYATWERCLEFSRRLHNFFTKEALDDLQEIR